MKLKIYNFVFETYEDEKDYYIDCDMNVINKDDHSVNPQCEVQLDQEWISIDKKLPEIKQWVMVYMDEAVMSHCDYAVTQYDKYGFNRSKVTHWMPLPNPPKF